MITKGIEGENIRRLSKNTQTIIGRIISASKNLKLYPASHPITKRIVSVSFNTLQATLKEVEILSLSLAGNVLLINDKPAIVTNREVVNKFLTILGTRKIGKITFIRGIDMDEFLSFIEVLGIEPDEIEKRGGLQNVFTGKNIHHISISGISYGAPEETRQAGIEWKELLALIAGSDEFIKKMEKDPEEVSRIMRRTLEEEKGSSGWSGKVREAVGNIAEKLFESFGEANIDAYTETVSRMVLVLSPEMQSEVLFSKTKIPFWEDVVNNVVDRIAAEELGDLVAKETKKSSDALIITGEKGKPGEQSSRLSNIDSFLSKFVDKSKRKAELIPAIRESFNKQDVKESLLDYMSGGKTKKELLEIIEEDLSNSSIDAKSLLEIKTLIRKNAHMEDLLKSLIDLLNNKKPEIRMGVIKSFIDLIDKLLIFGRMDLIKLIILAFSDRLGKEYDTEIFRTIVQELSTIAQRLIKEGKGTSAEAVDDILNNYLKTLEDKEKLEAVVKALSSIGDARALEYMIYSLNRDIAYNMLNAELSKKGEKVFPLLLRSMKKIEDKITRVRIISLIIDTAKRVPNFDTFLNTYVDDSKWYVRRNIAIILGEVGGERSIKLLSKLLNDKEPRVRIEVMESLGKEKTEDNEILLLEGLKDADRSVVRRALSSLRKIGSEMSIFALKELLEKKVVVKKEETLDIQGRVISVLSSIDGDEAVDILRGVIFDKNIFGRYKYDDKIRLLAVESLRKIDTKSAKQVLTRASWLKGQEVGDTAAKVLKKEKIL